MKFTLIPENEKLSHPLMEEYRNTHDGEDFFFLDTGRDLIILHEGFDIIAGISYNFTWLTEDIENIDITELKVNENFRRQGYGTEIMKYIFEMAKNQKKPVTLVCRSDNTIGQNFFAKLHFKKIKNGELCVSYDDIARYY
jgi:GNAT superfamily N-acetyltransferase